MVIKPRWVTRKSEGVGREGPKAVLPYPSDLAEQGLPTWILSRPRCAPRPKDWLLEASSWLSETRKDSKPRGGHPGVRTEK